MARKNLNARVAHAAMTAERVVQVQELRRSGAAGKHNTTPKSQRTRGAAKRAAFAEYR